VYVQAVATTTAERKALDEQLEASLKHVTMMVQEAEDNTYITVKEDTALDKYLVREHYPAWCLLMIA
jgi:hypothetical protein